MKHLLFTIYLILFSATFILSQDYPTLYPPKISPASPTTTDSIVYEITVAFSGVTEKIEDSILIREDTIYISTCYYEGAGSRPTVFKENFNLGLLPAGKYTIVFTAIRSHGINGCNPMDSNYLDTSFHVSFPSSAKDVEEKSSVHLMPNPAGNEQHIFLQMEKSQLAEILMLDLTGRTVKKVHKGLLPKGENLIAVDLADLPSGVYFYRILFGKEVEFVKVVKQ